jgi:hypothetical protein
MGMYVVAKLAYRHGLTVELIRGVPGITAKVTIPRDHLEIPKPAQPRPWESERDSSRSHGEVIDLTRPAMTEPVVAQRTSVAAPERPPVVDMAPGELPVRIPGRGFDEEDLSPPAEAGESAAAIKTALAAYERGRKAAVAAHEQDHAEAATGDQSE